MRFGAFLHVGKGHRKHCQNKAIFNAFLGKWAKKSLIYLVKTKVFGEEILHFAETRYPSKNKGF